MKKIFISLLLLIFLNIIIWTEETPDQVMNKLLDLFRQYNIASIPENISTKDFNEKIINNIVKEERKNFIFSVYIKDPSGNFYTIKKNLNEEDRKKIINTFHVINYRILTEEQKNENKKINNEIEKIFNYNALIIGALQDQWNKLTPTQKNEFLINFKGVVEVIAYPQGGYYYTNSKNTFKKTVYEGEKAIIASENYNIDKDIEITISYIFKKYNNLWTLVDVEMNQHSLVDAYRLQINRVVEKKGVDGLLADLKKMYIEMKAN